MVYIGPYNSGAAMESMPILNKGPLLQISPANTAVGLTKPSGKPGEPEIFFPTGKRTYCRVVGTDDVQGPLAAVWAKKLGMKTVYILDDKGTYGNGVAKEFKAKCDQLGLEVMAHEGIDVQATDFKSLLTKIGSKKPDLIYFGGTTQTKGAHLAKELAAANLSCKLMVPEGCLEGAFIKTALAENVNDRVYLTFPAHASMNRHLAKPLMRTTSKSSTSNLNHLRSTATKLARWRSLPSNKLVKGSPSHHRCGV